ncbi:MAG: L,D-transpeptidase family protein [Alphaproteobacteria bacterium]|nr:L,D-transpeptidase family protein [Alphaproteobacteria bacterium]
MGEGDGITPIGSFQIMGTGFRADRVRPPTSQVPALPIGPADIWSDDATDPAYNHGLSARAHPFSHERLFRADHLYDVFAILDFNWPLAVPGRGSVIFLHHWRAPRHPTEGCIAFAPRVLGFILEHWTAQSRVVIR